MIEKAIRRILNEASGTGMSRGSFIAPLQLGIRKFKDSQNGPFTKPVSKYDSPELEYDSYDGKLDTPKNKRKKIESQAKKVTDYIKKHPLATFSDEDGNVINQFPNGKNKKGIVPLNEWIEVTDDFLNEDLSVWFGTKKKPKGSSQPKGPWVNICRKVDGKHPPCGRPDTDKGGYPKCRASGVAGKMSDSQKKSACQQKRTAEKKDTQTGKGQKPVMTSYNSKKKKTLEESLSKIINQVLNNI